MEYDQFFPTSDMLTSWLTIHSKSCFFLLNFPLPLCASSHLGVLARASESQGWQRCPTGSWYQLRVCVTDPLLDEDGCPTTPRAPQACWPQQLGHSCGPPHPEPTGPLFQGGQAGWRKGTPAGLGRLETDAGVGSSPSRTLPMLPVASSYKGSEAGEGIGVRRDVKNGHGYAGGPNEVEKP